MRLDGMLAMITGGEAESGGAIAPAQPKKRAARSPPRRSESGFNLQGDFGQ